MSTDKVFLRYLALDAHKHYVVIGGVNAACELVLPPQRVELAVTLHAIMYQGFTP